MYILEANYFELKKGKCWSLLLIRQLAVRLKTMKKPCSAYHGLITFSFLYQALMHLSSWETASTQVSCTQTQTEAAKKQKSSSTQAETDRKQETHSSERTFRRLWSCRLAPTGQKLHRRSTDVWLCSQIMTDHLQLSRNLSVVRSWADGSCRLRSHFHYF